MNPCYVYLVRCSDTSFYKIGVADNPTSRLKELQIGNPYPLSLVVTCGFPSSRVAKRAESDAHKQMEKYNIHGEWFDLSPKAVEQLKFEMIGCGE